MKIAIVGYGRMGKFVEEYSKKRGHEVAIIINPSLGTKKEDLLNLSFDVIIDFSIPQVALENMRFYAKNNFKVIMGTTGWYEDLDEIKNLFTRSNGALLWAGNFSIGVHLFWKMIENASKIINKFEDYDVFGHEFHHNKKADSPSGTATKTANILLENIDRKTSIITEELSHRAIKPEELHFSSTRGGYIPGIHQVYFDSIFDTIKIEHSARTREGFALGSVVCAEWLNKKTGYFEIDDFIKEII
ncbi:MAG: 4-hydroxy-tetrahydrodipicolinate reductase [Candidatus Gracilibacteria bacterium]|nr:4-hydroxy-tetrahydrodipicolinate reductase [Candidatus Gracilibacteria bacterium]